MANLKLEDIITLGNMGFTKDDIIKMNSPKEAPAEVKAEATAEVKKEAPAEEKKEAEHQLTASDVEKMISDALQSFNIGNLGKAPEAKGIEDILNIIL